MTALLWAYIALTVFCSFIGMTFGFLMGLKMRNVSAQNAYKERIAEISKRRESLSAGWMQLTDDRERLEEREERLAEKSREIGSLHSAALRSEANAEHYVRTARELEDRAHWAWRKANQSHIQARNLMEKIAKGETE